MKRALITGGYGQDGSYLTEILLERGYEVTLLARPSGQRRTDNVQYLLNDDKWRLKLHVFYGDVTDPHLIVRLCQEAYDEIYLLAAQTQVGQSFFDPTYTLRVNAESPIAFFEACFQYARNTRIYFPGTSEMFSDQVQGTRANEGHHLGAHSPYAAAKVAAFLSARVYRKLGLFVVGGIGFNHESRRRGSNFVTRKIGLGIQIFKRSSLAIPLGDPTPKRDWHHAKDAMMGAWLSLQQPAPGEYVFASGVPRSVRQIAEDMCRLHDVNPERALIFNTIGETRPWEVPYLCGDPTKAETQLGWRRTISYEELLLDVSTE